MSNKLVILMGPPGSGKSTHAKTMEAQGYFRISGDDQGKAHRELFESHVCTGRDLVIDRMGFNKEQRDRFRLEAIKNGYTVTAIEFIVPRSVCFERCMGREDHPTVKNERNANDALDTYFKGYEPIDESEYSEVLRIHYNAPEKKQAIMCDLDGTLCNLDHRIHHVKNGNKDWGKFFRACGEDLVYDDVRSIVNLEHQSGTRIVFCSGRPEDYKRQTEMWLDSNIHIESDLVMRPRNNFKPDHITKRMLYEYEIKPYYQVKYVLDDRDAVVRMWRDIGLNCMQVRPGNF